MSSVQYIVGNAYRVAVALVAWLPGFNVARKVQPYLTLSEKEGRGGVAESLLERGWSPEWPAQGIALPYSEVLPDGSTVTYTADDVIAYRQAEIEKYLAAGNVAVANTCKRLWCDKDGNYIAPLFIMNSAFTRGLSLPVILTEGEKRAIAAGEVFDATKFEVVVSVRAFATRHDRLTEQAWENTSRRMLGTKDMDWNDILASGQAMIESAGEHANQRMLRRAFGDGNGMKAWGVLSVASRFPSLNILERVAMEKPEGWAKDSAHYSATGYLPIGSFPQNLKDLQAVASADDAEAWIAEHVFAKKSNKSKMISRTVLENAATTLGIEAGSPFDYIRSIFLADGSLQAIKTKYPELFSARCVLTLAEIEAAPVVEAAPVAKAAPVVKAAPKTAKSKR